MFTNRPLHTERHRRQSKTYRCFALAAVVAFAGGSAHGDITWNTLYEDLLFGGGFYDAQEGAMRRSTITAVTEYINSVVEADGTIDLAIFKSETDGTGALAHAGPYYPAGNGFFNGFAFEHATSQNDPDELPFDGNATFDFGFQWQSSLDAPNADQRDLFSNALHEITHILGVNSILVSGGISGLTGGNPGGFSVYDSHLTLGQGQSAQPLFAGGGEYVLTPETLTSNNVYFSGPNAVSRNNGSAIPVISPDPFQQGSIGHLSDPTAVMYISLPTGVVHRAYSAQDLGILEDLGWTLKPGVFWTSSNGGTLDSAHNWSQAMAPDSSSDVVFNVFSTYTANLSSDVTHRSADFVFGTVAIDGNGHTYTLVGSEEQTAITVDNRGSAHGPAQLLITSGTVSAPDAKIAGGADSAGLLHVNGAGTVAQLTDQIRIGADGGVGEVKVSANASLQTFGQVLVGAHGSVRVQEGAEIRSDTATINGGIIFEGGGAAVVTGDGSTWINNGEFRVGSGISFGDGATLEISDGGTVTSDTVAAQPAIGVGRIIIADPGSRLTTSQLALASSIAGSSGVVNVQNGGRLETESAGIGRGGNVDRFDDGSGFVSVDGVGSSWENTGSIGVGGRGRGTLRVTNGAIVETQGLTIGALVITCPTVSCNPGEGHVIVSGEGSLLRVTESFYNLDNFGRNTIEVSNGGVLDLTGTGLAGITAAVSLDGGAVVAAAMEITDVVSGSGVLDGDVMSAGKFSPGNSPGVLSITGDYDEQYDHDTQLGSSLAIEIGGTTAGSGHDQMQIGGAANLAGMLKVSLLGFAPQASDAFPILEAASVQGAFANAAHGERIDIEGTVGTFIVNYTPTSVVLTDFVFDGPPGDYNGNGVVDAADYTAWRDNLGESIRLLGDTTPGDVSLEDYDVWKANFGAIAASALQNASSNLVPEPTAMLLMLGTTTIVLGSRRIFMG